MHQTWVFEVALFFNGIIEIYPRPTLVAVVTELYIYLYFVKETAKQKIAHDSAYNRDIVENLATNSGCLTADNLTVSLIFTMHVAWPLLPW